MAPFTFKFTIVIVICETVKIVKTSKFRKIANIL
jgi:hypothetical protein